MKKEDWVQGFLSHSLRSIILSTKLSARWVLAIIEGHFIHLHYLTLKLTTFSFIQSHASFSKGPDIYHHHASSVFGQSDTCFCCWFGLTGWPLIIIDKTYESTRNSFQVGLTYQEYWDLTRCGPFDKICLLIFSVTSKSQYSPRSKGKLFLDMHKFWHFFSFFLIFWQN